MANARVWCALYKKLVPNWSQGVEVNHIQGGLETWKQIVMDDYMRRNVRWVVPSFESEFGMFIHNDDDEKELRLRIDLSQAITVRPFGNDPAPASGWKNAGPPVSHTHKTKTTISAYVQTYSRTGRTDYRLVFYDPSHHDTPLAIISSEFWAQTSDGHLDPDIIDNFSIAQLMDIKQFPEQKDDQHRIRVVVVLAFGDNNGVDPTAVDGDGQMNILDSWSLVKVIEIYICNSPPDSPSSSNCASLPRLIPYRPNPHRGQVRTFSPSSRDDVLRGRAIKIYNGPDPDTNENQERIAFFGIRRAASETVLLTSALFGPSKQSMTTPSMADHSKIKCDILCDKTTGRGLETSCMALFPPQSDFENLIVLLNSQGQGEIWDWVSVKKLLTLEIAGIETNSDREQQHQHQQPQQQDHQAQQDAEQVQIDRRKDLYYWGVQVNWAVEEPTGDERGSRRPLVLGHGPRKRGNFRVVALADGRDKEWETTWWHISELELRKTLKQALDQDKSELLSFIPRVIQSNSRHFEISTLGTTQIPSPLSLDLSLRESSSGTGEEYHLLFVAYLIWDHYRIALTSRFGLCVVDMDQEQAGDVLDEDMNPDSSKRPSQWVTVLENSEDDPLVDIATLGDCLLLTRKYSHMIWPFREVIQGTQPLTEVVNRGR
ncbi:hypothetical protein BGX28_005245 [Mortierella sp. GBA30]|nr:hypothetical protein BGX28_005245 [Mortierella sp. GBA30]